MAALFGSSISPTTINSQPESCQSNVNTLKSSLAERDGPTQQCLLKRACLSSTFPADDVPLHHFVTATKSDGGIRSILFFDINRYGLSCKQNIMTLKQWQGRFVSNLECFVIIQTRHFNEKYIDPSGANTPFIIPGTLYLNLLHFLSFDYNSIVSSMHSRLNVNPRVFVNVFPQIVFKGSNFVLYHKILHHFDNGHLCILTIKLYDIGQTQCCLRYAYETEDIFVKDLSKVVAPGDVLLKLSTDVHYIQQYVNYKKADQELFLE